MFLYAKFSFSFYIYPGRTFQCIAIPIPGLIPQFFYNCSVYSYVIKLVLKLSLGYYICTYLALVILCVLQRIHHCSCNHAIGSLPTQNTIYHLNYHLCSFVWKIQHSDTCLEINTAFSFILCCINLFTCPLMVYFSYTLAMVL